MSVLICGSLAFDTITTFPGRFAQQILPEQVHILNVSFLVPTLRKEFGGCAGNIAYSLQQLGGQPRIMATLGKDGALYRNHLDSLGMMLHDVRMVEDDYTAQAIIITDQDNNQITAFHPGAMNRSHLNRVPDGSGITLGVVAPDGRQGMLEHAEQFAEAGIHWIFDPGQGLPMFDGTELLSFISKATWVAVNDYEGQLLSERTGLALADIARKVKALVVTRGAQGSVIHADGRAIEIPAARPRALTDPPGCGDAYRAGLIYGLMHGLDWETTGRIASLMGALKIAHAGTQNHRFAMDEFRAEFRAAFGRDL
jgi:adenosine kinase